MLPTCRDFILRRWQDYDNASGVLSKAAKLMADTDGRAACDLFIAAMDIMKVNCTLQHSVPIIGVLGRHFVIRIMTDCT
jgi:hypothetical protein